MKKGFKYTVVASQAGAIRAGITPAQLDLTDLAIFDAITELAGWDGIEKMTAGGKIYFKIDWSVIPKRLPFAGLNSRSPIKKRIAKLTAAGLLDPHPDNIEAGQSWFCFGARYGQFINQEEAPARPEHPVREKDTPSSTEDGPRPLLETDPVLNGGRNEYTYPEKTFLEREHSPADQVNNQLKKIEEAISAVKNYFAENSGARQMAIGAAKFTGNFEEELETWVRYYANEPHFLNEPLKKINKFTIWLSRHKNLRYGNRTQKQSTGNGIGQYQTRYGTGEQF